MRSLTANDLCTFNKRDRTATDKLLSILREHHDYSIPAPPPKPAPVVVTDEWVERQKSKTQWFAIVEDLGPEIPQPPAIHEIVSACCRYFKMPRNEMLAERRTGKVVHARHVAMYLAKTITRRSLPEIGRKLGGRDHTTVLHGIRKMERTVRTSWMVAFDVAHVEAML